MSVIVLELTLLASCTKDIQWFNFNGKWKTHDAFYTLTTESEGAQNGLSFSLSDNDIKHKNKKTVTKTNITSGSTSEGTWRIQGDVLFFDFPSKGIGIFSGLDLTTTESFEVTYLFENVFWATKRSDKDKGVKFSRIKED